MRDAWFIARKDVQFVLRDRESMIWIFVMPVVFFWFIGTVTSGFSGSGSARDSLIVEYGENVGFLGERVAEHLRRDFDLLPPDSPQDDLPRLVLPANLTQSVLEGVQAELSLHRAAGSISGDYTTIRVARGVYTTLADVIAAHEQQGAVTPESLAQVAAAPRNLSLEVRAAGQRRRIPTGFEQTIPGILVMFTLSTLLSGGASLLVQERRAGLLRRLASSPIPRGTLVWGKWLGKMALGLVQVTFGVAAGTLIFSMPWGRNLPWVLGVLLFYCGLCASLGLLLGVLARTEGQAVGLGVLSANVLAALGGCWWPIEITPPWMQALQKCLPTGWAMDAMHRLISYGYGPGSVLGHVLGMAAAGLLCGWIGARKFRYF